MDMERFVKFGDMRAAELEDLPFGAIRISQDGTIRSYNAYESSLAQLAAEQVIGKNFFQDVAPCTRVRAFQGRMHDFLATGALQSETFDYTFPFAHGTAEVAITFVRATGDDSILIVVERTDILR